MKIRYLLSITVCIVSLHAKSSEPQVPTLDIDTLIEIALQHSPDIHIRKLDFKAAQQRTKQSLGFYLPRVDIDVSGGQNYAKLKHQPSQNTDLLLGRIGASQLLYDFGKTTGRIGASEQEALALEAQMQQTISDKILLVKKSYYEILKIKNIIDVQHKNVSLQQQQLYRAQKYLKSGIKTIIDVSDAKVQLEQAKLDLKNAQYQLSLERTNLEEILGTVPYDGHYRLYNKIIKTEGLAKKLPQMHSTLQSLEGYAYKHRYILESSHYYVEGAQANVEASRGEYYPTLSLQGNYQNQHVDNVIAALTPEQQGQIAVTMNWNLFSGYQTDASVEEAKLSVLKASSQVESIKLQVKREIHGAYIRVHQSRDNVLLTESISHASHQKFIQAQKRYENELSDYVELQDAQQGYIQALSDVVKAYYDYFIAMATLDHAIGR